MSQTNNNVLPDSIANVPHLAAFDSLVAARMSNIELESLLVYVIDTVSASAIPTLARQFDVEGFQGYGLATTDEQRRAIIKQAIELKRYMGTVWAIKQAMISVGYNNATLIERSGTTGDVKTDWARFKIESSLGDTIGVDGTSQAYLAKLVREYKNVRSVLDGISFTVDIFDTLGEGSTDSTRFVLEDILNIVYEAPTLDEDLGYFGRFHDGTYLRDGSIKHIESLDSLTINIQNVP